MTDKQIQAVHSLTLGQSLWIDSLNGWYAVTMSGLVFFDRDDKDIMEGQIREVESLISTRGGRV